MPSQKYTQEEITRYLYAEMSEAECEALEDALFENSALFDAVSEAENDLIDNYVRGVLPPREHQRFEQNYLTHPSRLRRVQNARALLTKCDQLATVREPINRKAVKTAWWRRLLISPISFPLPAALAMLLIAGAGLWTWSEIRSLRNQVANLQAAQLVAEQHVREAIQQANTPRLPDTGSTSAKLVSTPTPAPTPANANSTIATLLLSADLFRGISGQPAFKNPLLMITPNIRQVRLVLKTPATDYRSYQAELQNASGEPVLPISTLRHQKSRTASTFTATIPADKLIPGDYFLVIKGVTSQGETDRLANAQFHAEKK